MGQQKSNKHAFLIMAHNCKEQLINLIKLLDDPDNDLYIHIDRKVHLVDNIELISTCKYSKVCILRSVNVSWGAYSQIECELALLREAAKEEHLYYHLISGTDLPVKTNEEIHKFFLQNQGKEFVHFQDKYVKKTTINHVKYYHFLQEYANSFSPFFNKIVRGAEHVLIGLQKVMHVNRCTSLKVFQKGANWFSITNSLALFVISKEKEIQKHFKYTLSGDELFMQTIIINSTYSDKLYRPLFDDSYLQCVRYIDWNRGRPYVFQKSDLEELLDCDAIFARKCSVELSSVILNLRNR